MKKWAQHEAIELCTKIEPLCRLHGCHVALTGGLLYKWQDTGEGFTARKDADLILYRHREELEIDFEGLWADLEKMGVKRTKWEPPGSFVIKAEYDGKRIDFLIPEACGAYDYNRSSVEDVLTPFDGESAPL